METIIATSINTLEIPPKVAKRFGIKKGIKMHFVEERDHIIIFPVTNEVIDRNIGFLGTNGKLLKALLAEKKKEKRL